MNNVVLIGRLTKDPEIRYTQSDKPMCCASYTLAVDRQYKKEGEQTADFIRCKAFGKSAELAEKYFQKGIKIAVKGRIQTGSYEKDGITRYTTDVIIENQEFAESKASSEQNKSEQNTQENDGFAPIPEGADDELPF